MKYSFILVRPKVPENIGASARAIKTMGFDSLVLIDPCEDPEERAGWLAHGSLDILQNAKIYSSLEEARIYYDLLIATTTRKRKIQTQAVPVRSLSSFIGNKGKTVKKLALVFGNEESGLSNSDIAICDISSEVPMAVEFPSLNLSQAVMLYAYELSGFSRANKIMTERIEAKNESLRTIREKVKDVLDETGISDNPALSGKIIERLAFADEKDLKLIHSLSSAVLDKIKCK